MRFNKKIFAAAILAVTLFISGMLFGFVIERIYHLKHQSLPFARKIGPGKDFSAHMLKKFSRELRLNDAQKEQVGRILDGQKVEMEKLNLEIKPKIDAQMQNFRAQIKAVLDDKQKIEFDKIILKHEERRKGLQP
jgi:Spy/CpxP family protein refolding chaperone